MRNRRRPVSTLGLLLLALSSGACNCGRKGPNLNTADATPSASDLDFGSVPVNQTKVLELPLTNSGSITLQTGKLTLGGTNPGNFKILGSYPSTGIAAGVTTSSATSIQVSFTPGAPGGYAATLSIPSNSNATPVLVVTLVGIGGDSAIFATPQPLNFGDVLVGAYATQTLTLTNAGKTASDPIQILPIIGPQAAEFNQTSTPASIPPNGTLAIQVTFGPTATGAASASLPVILCTGCTQTSLTLIGQGVEGALTFVPNPVSFSGIPTGASNTQQVTATNTGSAMIEVAQPTLQDGGASHFALSGLPTFPLYLAPVGAFPDAGPQSFTFSVSYAPVQPNGDMDQISVPWEAPGGVPTAALDPVYGNTKLSPCQLAIAPPSVNFGNAPVGQLVKKKITLTNSGQETCTVSGIALDPTGDPAFSLPSGGPTSLTIPASGSAQLEVDCTVPSAPPPTSRRGTLDFASTDPLHASEALPLTVFLSGSSPYSAGWPKWHYDNTDRGQSEADTSALQGTVAWTYPVTPPSQATGLIIAGTPTYMNSPVVDATGNVYQTTFDGHLIAVDPSGTLLWSAPIASPAQDPHPATPIIAADGTLYLESGTDSSGAYLYHFLPDGGQLAAVPPPTDLCNPNGTDASNGNNNGCPDGFDVCPSIGNGGMLFDGDDFGATLTYTRNSSGSLTEGKGTVLQYAGERVAVALDDSDDSYWCSGPTCWGVTAPSAGFGTMSGWGGSGQTIDSNAGGGGFSNSDLAFDRDHTGWLMVEVAWLGLGSFLGGSSTAQTALVAMDPTDGAVKWKYEMPSFTTPTSSGITGGIFSADFGNSAPAIADDGTVYVGNGDGLYAFDGATGTIKPGFPFQSADVDTAVAIGGDGTIFFGCQDGAFYAIWPNGQQRFKIVTQGRISASPAIGPDGTVFFVSDEGNLYAIR